MSRTAFTKRFPDDAACAQHLVEKRWPNGFVCPKCQSTKAWALDSKEFTFECAACGRQTSVTAGTIFHRSKLPLLTWFLAIYAIASHSNGISALQLQAQLGLGSYKTAWLMLQKLRRAMVDPDRSFLDDLVEVDESDIPYRTKNDPIAGGQGRSPVGKLHFIGAIELSPDGHPRRIRLAPLKNFSAASIGAFITAAVKPGATILSDGFSAYKGLKVFNHQPKVVGKMAAHIVLPWIHRVFANFKRWALGTYHGVRKPHLRRYLDEFVFRWNRRRHMKSSFDMLLDIAAHLPHAGYKQFVNQSA
jgi:transposase-like protein/Zn ribbon nucleic-acid-binding protein